jgi:hypothetical protein
MCLLFYLKHYIYIELEMIKLLRTIENVLKRMESFRIIIIYYSLGILLIIKVKFLNKHFVEFHNND